VTIRDHAWSKSHTQAVSVFRASLMGQIAWPSGRTTSTMLASAAVMSDMDAACSVYGPEHVRRAKEANARTSISAAAQRASNLAKQGWWIRTLKRGRQRARRIEALVWL
jgi:hypothetical protein